MRTRASARIRAQKFQGGFVMPGIPGAVSNLVAGYRANLRRLVLASAGVAAVLMLAPAQRAQALSLASPGAVPLSAKYVSDGLIEVRGGHGGGHGSGGGGGGFRGGGGGFHGGGGGFHGGGFRGGGAAFHGGGFRAGPAFHGGFHRGGFAGRHVFVGHRHHFRGRHFFRPRFYGGYYPYYYGPRCRVIWTYYGPRRICRYHRWHHRHWRWHRRYW
jgi:hypothetical protein